MNLFQTNMPPCFISDIDECASNSGLGPCEMSCNNTDGEFHCTCDDGYGLLPDTVSCQSKSLFMSIIVYPSQSLVAFIYIRFLCLPYINVPVVKGHKSPVITRTPTYMRVHSQQFLNHLKNFWNHPRQMITILRFCLKHMLLPAAFKVKVTLLSQLSCFPMSNVMELTQP